MHNTISQGVEENIDGRKITNCCDVKAETTAGGESSGKIIRMGDNLLLARDSFPRCPSIPFANGAHRKVFKGRNYSHNR